MESKVKPRISHTFYSILSLNATLSLPNKLVTCKIISYLFIKDKTDKHVYLVVIQISFWFDNFQTSFSFISLYQIHCHNLRQRKTKNKLVGKFQTKTN